MHLYNEIKEDRQTSNCFLAYYLYPELFVDEDWKKIFDTALKELKTPWGGIRSLSKFHEAYRDRYTGENNESYHQGDSWYWINHLSAYVLQRLDSKYYQKTITGIILSSTKDLFEMGSMGYISEVSSAGEQEAAGCFAQLWSVATYLELIREVYGTDKR
jgi:glycogen debranching enzyme